MDSPNSGSRRSIIITKQSHPKPDRYISFLIIGIIDDISSGGTPMDRVTTGVTKPATVRDMSVTPYCAAVKKYVYSGTSRNVINFVDTVFTVNKPIFTSRFLYLPKKLSLPQDA